MNGASSWRYGAGLDQNLDHPLPAGGALAAVAFGLAKMNLALSVFNMLPLPQLDGKYTVFGQCIEGLDVLHAIQKGDRMIEVRIDYVDPAGVPADARRSKAGLVDGDRGRPPHGVRGCLCL